MTKQTGLLAVSLFCFCLLAGLSGCGGPEDQPDLGQVSGTVTLDGVALNGAELMFTPDNGRPAFGHTDPMGKYTVIYIRDTPGCKTGHNRVEISMGEVEDAEDEMEGEGDDAVQNVGTSEQIRIPARYNTESELEVDVKPGENAFDFDLKSS